MTSGPVLRRLRLWAYIERPLHRRHPHGKQQHLPNAAHAHSPDWLQAVSGCLAQLDDASPGANLGFLYVTDGFTEHLPRILGYLKEQTDIEDLVGTGICGTGQEYYDEPAISVMLAELPAGSFRVFPSIRADISEFTQANRDWCATAHAHFAIVHGARCPQPPRGGVYYSCLGRGNSMFGPNSEELKTIHQELGEFPLVGFFANGEISHNRLYGFTGVLTLFR